MRSARAHRAVIVPVLLLLLTPLLAGCGGSRAAKTLRQSGLAGATTAARATAAGCPARARLVVSSRQAVAPGAGPLVTAGESAWVASPASGQLVRVAPGVRISRRLAGTPVSLALRSGRLWVAERDGARIVSLDAASLRPLTSTGVPLPVRVLSAPFGLWALSLDTASLYQLDPATGTSVRRLDAPVADPTDMVAAGGELWVLGAGEQGLSPVSAALGRSVRAGFALHGQALAGLSAAGRTIWLGETAAGSLLRVDSGDVRVQRLPAPAAMRPLATAVGACGLWVAGASGELALIDPDTARPIAAPLHVGRSVGALAASGTGVWVSDPLGGALVRVELAP